MNIISMLSLKNIPDSLRVNSEKSVAKVIEFKSMLSPFMDDKLKDEARLNNLI